jgi:type IV secretory pathway VirB3-like protein
MSTENAPIYRSLHGAPMLAGVPAHYALILVGVAALMGFGVMAIDRIVGLSVVGADLLLWAVLVFVFSQDRVQVPLFVLRMFHRFPRRITSYSRSRQRIVIVE